MKNILFLFINIFLIETLFPGTVLFSQQLSPTRDIPVIESRASEYSDFYVIFLTGNGGWRNLAKYLTTYMNSKHVSVLAINTKKYLLSEKKPAQIACDLEALVDRYDIKWGKDSVVFIGYSMGAEVLPFAVNRMEEKYISKLEDMILIGPWQKATFKVKLADYFYEVNKGDDIYEELQKMKLKKSYVICDDNEYSICLKDLQGVIDHEQIGGGHHFGGDYGSLARMIGKRLDLE
jgi:type IV secretory pathway VirJ component